jgi:precorrin-3B synthase
MNLPAPHMHSSAVPHEVKGWCPSLLRPMASGDGLIARLKPTAATFRCDDLRAVAEAAVLDGNGHFELTRRGNLQARGFDAAGHARFAEAVVARGLAAENASAEARRTVLAAPLSPADNPQCGIDAHALARDLEAALGAADDLAALPGKFGFAVDSGGALSIAPGGPAPGADITLGVYDGRIALMLAGEREMVAPVTLDRAVSVTLVLARHFVSRMGPRIRRMADLVTLEGAGSVIEAVGLSATAHQPPEQASEIPVGRLALTPGTCAIVAAAPFGRISADQLTALCTLAETHADGALRLTPWRSLVLAGVAISEAQSVLDRCKAMGLIVTPDDARLHIAACTGAPGCSHAHAPVLDDAARFAERWQGPGLLHVSGCAKGCAHSGPAAVTLVASAVGYGWIENGSPQDLPTDIMPHASDVFTRLKDRSS